MLQARNTPKPAQQRKRPAPAAADEEAGTSALLGALLND
jgi:hypothetical protein